MEVMNGFIMAALIALEGTLVSIWMVVYWPQRIDIIGTLSI